MGMCHVKHGGSTCFRCGGFRDRKGQAYCRACHNAYARENRPKYRDLTPEARFKNISRAYANVRQRQGILVPQPCEVCGADQVEKHHEDYAKPLAVMWLCRECHRSMH